MSITQMQTMESSIQKESRPMTAGLFLYVPNATGARQASITAANGSGGNPGELILCQYVKACG